jgi:hypothetical protein
VSTTAVVVQGVVRRDGTLELAEKLAIPEGRVQVIIQALPDPTNDPFWQRLEAIWSAQKARGHEPPSANQVEAARRALRDETEQEIQEAIHLQEACREARR